ncbi:Telomerase-binding protein EST1A [Plecturocebus cupreus]
MGEGPQGQCRVHGCHRLSSLSPLFPGRLHHPKEEDVVIEDFEEDSEAEGSGGEDDIRELRAKKLALARKIAEQQRRQEKIQSQHTELVLNKVSACSDKRRKIISTVEKELNLQKSFS